MSWIDKVFDTVTGLFKPRKTMNNITKDASKNFSPMTDALNNGANSAAQLAQESNAWRNLLENAQNNIQGSIRNHGLNAGANTAIVTFIGNCSRNAIEYAGYSKKAGERAEFLMSMLTGAALAFRKQIVSNRPDALMLRMLGCLSVSLIQRAIQAYSQDKNPLLWASVTKTAIDLYSDPLPGIVAAASFFGGNYVGHKIGVVGSCVVAYVGSSVMDISSEAVKTATAAIETVTNYISPPKMLA